MLVLALDTALAACSAALCDTAKGRVLALRSDAMQRGHAEALAPMVEAVMAQAREPFAAIDRIAVTVGPGTFTGLRVGLSFSRGLGLALRKPVVGFSTLEAIALGQPREASGRPVAVAIDARRDEIYFQLFSGTLAPLTEPLALPVEEAAALLPPDAFVLGSGAPLLGAPAAAELPDVAAMAMEAARRPVSAEPPRPLYLRAADAKPQAAQVTLAPRAVDIATATAHHAAILAALHAASFPSPWPSADIARLMAMPGALALVATEPATREPLGFVLARTAADEAEILTIAVEPGARRRGVGRALLEAAGERLAAAGARSLFIEVARGNGPAQALYRRFGFRESGMRAGYYALPDGSHDDALVMRVDTGPAPLRVATGAGTAYTGASRTVEP